MAGLINVTVKRPLGLDDVDLPPTPLEQGTLLDWHKEDQHYEKHPIGGALGLVLVRRYRQRERRSDR